MLKINFLKFTKYISGYKKMILTIHQPEYLPWMGFFNKLSYADVYVALDNVQYRHKYFQNRNKILTSNGECWLNVPVYRKGNRDIFIQDIKINNIINWRDKTWKNIYYSYKKAPYFKQYSDYFENVYSTEWENLVDLNLDIIENICKFLNFKVDIVKASDLNIDGIGPELILDVCKLFKPDVYIAVQDIWGIDFAIPRPWFNKIQSALWTTLDSLPILPSAINAAKKVDNFWVWSNFAEKDMHKQGLKNVKTLHGALDEKHFCKL